MKHIYIVPFISSVLFLLFKYFTEREKESDNTTNTNTNININIKALVWDTIIVYVCTLVGYYVTNYFICTTFSPLQAFTDEPNF